MGRIASTARMMVAAASLATATIGMPVAAGEKMVVVTDGDSKVLAVDNQDALKGHEGHHVAVTGKVKGDSIHVEDVKML